MKQSFVVHRHHGSITHYYLRFEIHGTTWSWLVPNGPSLNPRDRRLAILVEGQETTAASPNYRQQEIWDKGNYASVGYGNDNAFITQIKAGNFKFVLNGKKLKGSFRLLHLKEKGKNLWMLIKGNDQFAVDYHYNAEDFAKGNTPTWQSRYAD